MIQTVIILTAIGWGLLLWQLHKAENLINDCIAILEGGEPDEYLSEL